MMPSPTDVQSTTWAPGEPQPRDSVADMTMISYRPLFTGGMASWQAASSPSLITRAPRNCASRGLPSIVRLPLSVRRSSAPGTSDTAGSASDCAGDVALARDEFAESPKGSPDVATYVTRPAATPAKATHATRTTAARPRMFEFDGAVANAVSVSAISAPTA